MRPIFSIVLLLMSVVSYAASELSVSFLSSDVGQSTDLGIVEVEGAGRIKLIASKNGNQLIVHARGPDGTVIGRAESVIGVRDTPIYVSTSDGLQKITILWGAELD